MPSETSTYPGTVDVLVDQEAKRDIADKSVINRIQNCIEAIETELGTDPAGTQTDLKTFLQRCLATNGAMRQGTGMPGSPNEGDFFYRTDQDVMYIYDGSAWDAQGQSLSNLLFAWTGKGTTGANLHYTNTLDPNNAGSLNVEYLYFKTTSTVLETVIQTKLRKLPGVATARFYAYAWHTATGGSRFIQVKVDIGGQNATATMSNGGTPEWVTADVDISGLSDGTVYDVTVSIVIGTSEVAGALGALAIFGL